MKLLSVLFTITLLSALCACRNSAPSATSPNQSTSGKTFTDLLAAQLEAINYPSVITREGELVTVRLGAASASDVRRAICQPRGWPAGSRMVRLDETLRRLRLAEGVTRLRLIGQNETLDVQLNSEGKCER